MENKAVFKKFPYLLVGISIFGIAVIIIMGIGSWGKVKGLTYFGYFMNILFYVNLLSFALRGYSNKKSLEKEPVKGLLKSFCILLFMVTITSQPIIISVAVIYGIVIVIDIIMMKNLKNLKVCRILALVILVLLIAAAIIKLGTFGNMPRNIILRGAWFFDVYNQVIQWTAFGLTYILRFTEFKKAGYIE